MNKTRLVSPYGEKQSLLLNGAELNSVGLGQVSFDGYALLSHVKEALFANTLEQLLGPVKQCILNLLPKKAIEIIDDRVCFKSELDGSRITFTAKDILWFSTLVDHLVVPKEFLNLSQFSLRSNYFIAVPFDELKEQDDKMPLALEINNSNIDDALNALLEIKLSTVNKIIYIVGDISLQQIRAFVSLGVDFIESNSVYQDACRGYLWSDDGILDITSGEYVNAHASVMGVCACYTCQHHTKAYLHHLHKETPLLAIKLSAIHNAHYISNHIKSDVR